MDSWRHTSPTPAPTTGTFLGIPPTGRPIITQEFAVYRVDAGKIAEVWVTADNLRLLTQLR